MLSLKNFSFKDNASLMPLSEGDLNISRVVDLIKLSNYKGFLSISENPNENADIQFLYKLLLE